MYKIKLSISAKFVWVFFLICFVTYIDAVGQQRLLVVGGGSRPPAAVKKFVEWSGGDKAKILVITWASAEPEESFAALKKNFDEAKPQSVIHAQTRPLDDAKRKLFVGEIENSTGVFFSGGDQNRIMDILADKDLLALLRKKYDAGMPFGGTSAGAAIMSDPMMTGEANLKKIDPDPSKTRAGLGLLPNSIIDQHFILRQRYNRLFSLMMLYPKRLAIGIDEDMAILVKDNRKIDVVGPTQVMFATTNSDGSMKLRFLKNGESFTHRKNR